MLFLNRIVYIIVRIKIANWYSEMNNKCNKTTRNIKIIDMLKNKTFEWICDYKIIRMNFYEKFKINAHFLLFYILKPGIHGLLFSHQYIKFKIKKNQWLSEKSWSSQCFVILLIFKVFFLK